MRRPLPNEVGLARWPDVRWREYPWAILLGMLALYGPVYLEIIGRNGLDDGIEPAVIGLISAWLGWRCRPALQAVRIAPSIGVGMSVLLFGLLLFVLGRIVAFPPAHVGSQIPVLVGLVLVFRGWAALRVLAFPILFLLFMVPLPGSVVVELTAPLRQWAALLSTELLRLADYPVALNGTLISLGRYMLLVNEACSGLGSMFSLAATGLLYVYLAGVRSGPHRAILIAAIVPIAFAANVLRILVLALLTHHFGDSMAQGPAHDLTGLLLFAFALAMLFGLDALLRRGTGWQHAS